MAGQLKRGVLAIGVLTLAGCAQFNPLTPEVSFRGVSLRSIALQGAVLDVDLGIKNPNSFKLEVQRLTYELFADTLLVGGGQPDNPLVVPPMDSARIKLPIAVNYSGLGSVVVQLISKGLVGYRVKGQVTFGTPIGPMTRDYDQKGNFTAGSIR
jgi:LEA14-like dessication related protein